MKKLTLSGVPRAGKSTFAQLLAQRHSVATLNPTEDDARNLAVALAQLKSGAVVYDRSLLDVVAWLSLTRDLDVSGIMKLIDLKDYCVIVFNEPIDDDDKGNHGRRCLLNNRRNYVSRLVNLAKQYHGNVIVWSNLKATLGDYNMLTPEVCENAVNLCFGDWHLLKKRDILEILDIVDNASNGTQMMAVKRLCLLWLKTEGHPCLPKEAFGQLLKLLCYHEYEAIKDSPALHPF